MIYLILKPSPSFFVYHIQNKENCFTEKELFKVKEKWRIRWKWGFLTALSTAIKNDPKTSIKKACSWIESLQENCEDNKEDLSPDFNSFDYAIWDVLENKTNATSHPNIGSLKTAIKEEWNKMSEEYIFKTCKLLGRCVNTIIEKNGGHME